MDLSQFEVEDTDVARMPVVSPVTGEPLTADDGSPVTISLISQDSQKFRSLRRKAIDRRLKNRGARQTYTAAQAEADSIEALCDATVGWENVVLDGEQLECTPDNVRKVYKRLPWLVTQVDAFVADLANFMQPSPKT